MADPWAWWRAALANPDEIGKSIRMSPDVPEQGFFKTRYKDSAWEPVAIWQDTEGRWEALRGGKEVKADEVWNWCCRHPVTHSAYEQALNGGGWDEDDPTVASLIGHNVGSDLDALADQIEAAKQGAEAYRVISTDEQAAKAQSLRARMNELAGEADKKREAAKRPHLEAGKKIDAEWQPLIKGAKAVADMLKWAIGAFETDKLRARRAEEARQREEAEKAGAVEEAPPPLPPDADRIKGSYGRAAHVSAEKVVTAITDPDALFAFLKDHPELRALMLALANRALKAGREVPGVRIEERANIR